MIDENIAKLAKVIKLAGKEIAKDRINKIFDVGIALGLHEYSDLTGIIEVEDDSGFRSIIIGDIGGTGKDYKGYIYLYEENASYVNYKPSYKYGCFPRQRDIAARLQRIVDGDLDGVCKDYSECVNHTEKGFENFPAELIKKYAEAVGKDERTAEQIVGIRERTSHER
jgi:hypothetical protein